MNLFLLPWGARAVLLLVLVTAAAAVERMKVDHAYVTGLAEKLAARPYEPADRKTPKFFREINYDTYRSITFRPEKTLWRNTDLRFQVQFLHPGYLFTRMVRMNEFSSTHAQAIPFSADFFDYHDLKVPLLSRHGLNFAGFRLLHPLNEPHVWDEIISFVGASYFRGLARHQVYGASARGLAVNAGGPAAEEFPEFTEYWLSKPEPGAASVTVHALLDGPSVTGAYTFLITPSEELLVETKATLFFRQAVATPGFAPLSSMFWFGEGSPGRFGDFRPEVHDSDGLLVAPDAATRLWRPLRNPPAVTSTDFDAPALAGFGLLQRDRDARSYEDIEARYERRPSVWTEPIGAWPPGRVRLVETPTQNESRDNVTVFWSPVEKVVPGRPFELAWKQHWTGAPTFGGPPGWVRAVHLGLNENGAADRTKFVIDFDTASLAQLPAEANLTADVTISPGAEILRSEIFRNLANGARRLVVVLSAPVASPPVELRARILLDQNPVTETLVLPWQP